MNTHDSDNIPVLEDVIRDPEVQPAEAAALKQKQKALWDEETDKATDDEISADGFVTSEPDATGTAEAVDTVPADEQPDPDTSLLGTHAEATDTVFELHAQPHDDAINQTFAERPEAAPHADTHWPLDAGDVGFSPLATAADATPQENPGPATPAEVHPAHSQVIDIDRLADAILREMLPDLERELRRRIRSALEKNLGASPPD